MKDLHLDAKLAFSQNLKRLRKAKGLTQDALEDAIKGKGHKVLQSTISQLEKAITWPDYPTIKGLCAGLECEHTELTSHPDLLLYFKTQAELRKEIK